MPASLLLVDDHTLFRTGLRLIVQDHPGVDAIFEAGTVAEACALRPETVDLVLLDIQMPGMSGLDGLRLLRQAFPRARIVLVSASVAPDAVYEARTRGADQSDCIGGQHLAEPADQRRTAEPDAAHHGHPGRLAAAQSSAL